MSVRIKFCGFTRAKDVQLAVELGVDFIGLIFAPKSPRRVSLAQARELRALIPPPIQSVALLMDNAADEVREIVRTVQPDILQFHGGESDAFAASVGLPFWKVIAMGSEADPVARFAEYPHAAAFLLDGHGMGEQGGSGKAFDWSKMPQSTAKPVLLAGGLNPGNMGHALQIAQPWGVDVSSGIESAPGLKDAEKMRAFVYAARTP
ncbi:MAG: phosphoribosylanthranilate isomerase [Pseudoxanthomonas sp.]